MILSYYVYMLENRVIPEGRHLPLKIVVELAKLPFQNQKVFIKRDEHLKSDFKNKVAQRCEEIKRIKMRPADIQNLDL